MLTFTPRSLILFVVALFNFAFLQTDSYGQERVFGQDYLALQLKNFDAKTASKYITKHSACGILDYTFGTSLTPVTNLLDSLKCVYLRIHIINGTCISNQNCGPYEIGKGYTVASFQAAVLKKDPKIINFLVTRTKLYCDLAANYQDVKFIYSPVLEHKLGTKAYRILADTVLKTCPGAKLGNNPSSGDGERYRGAWLESHDGFKKPRDIVSFDGLDATDADITTWLKTTSKTKIAFVWTRSFNCRTSGGPFIDPRARKACPMPRDFDMLAHITDDREVAPAPTFKCNFKPFKAPFIWKPLAESYPNSSDPRQNLPVAITNFNSKDVQVVGVKGISIGILKYFRPYQSGLNRHYSGTGLKLSGYQIEKYLVKSNNSPYAYLKQGSTCVGPIIAGRRNGLYR